jgi:beta-xylosidase
MTLIPVTALIAISSILWLWCGRSPTYSNPVVYQDFADCDVFLGPNDTFYYSASNMHYSPGAPILRSYDLVNWQIIGHSIPSLSWSPKYDMSDDETAYVKGTWASTLRYRKSNGLWYWMGCIEFDNTYVYTASEVKGPWSLSSTIDKCYYDCGLFIDDDDTMYIVYGQREIHLALLSPDGLSEVKSQLIFKMPYEMDFFEGARMYKRNGQYYVIGDHPLDYEFVWKADNPWGPYQYRLLVDNASSPIIGGTTPNQGSLVELPDGSWNFVSFTSVYPLGRVPVVAPVIWDEDEFPRLVEAGKGKWGESYRYPLKKNIPVYQWTGTTRFEGQTLTPDWEWNHNPDASKYTVDNGLVLHAATVTDDLFHARNTLTHRTNGQYPVSTIEIAYANMADGDQCGIAAFRQNTSWIGIVRQGSMYSIRAVRHAAQDPDNNWSTISIGEIMASVPLNPDGDPKIWLRVSLDARPSGTLSGNVSYSLGGDDFTVIGDSFGLDNDWRYFMGYRFGIFNFATKALGGSVKILSFTQE